MFVSVSPVAYFAGQPPNGYIRPISGSSSSYHVVSGESHDSTVLSSLSSNRSSPNEETVASPSLPAVQQCPTTPKSAPRHSLSQQTSPGDDGINVIVGK